MGEVLTNLAWTLAIPAILFIASVILRASVKWSVKHEGKWWAMPAYMALGAPVLFATAALLIFCGFMAVIGWAT